MSKFIANITLVCISLLVTAGIQLGTAEPSGFDYWKDGHEEIFDGYKTGESKDSMYLLSSEAAPEAMSYPAAKEELGLFQQVNGITLQDDPDVIVAKLGEPAKRSTDPYLKDMLIYEYEHMNISFSKQYLQYVEFKSGSLTLADGTVVPLQLAEITAALGEPDQTAEDGIVYCKGHACLKFYYDESGTDIDTAHYFHIYTT